MWYKMKKHLVFLFLFTSFLNSQDLSKFNSLAMTPPMGWNSWNKFRCDVSEQLIMEIADAMVQSGMKDLGYQYVVIDDCWQIGRDSLGNLIPDSVRFPSGIKALSDYVHSKGLKFGMYTCAGLMTCKRRPGMRGYEYQDARQYAAWEIDYLKIDWCFSENQNALASYSLIRKAIEAAGRPYVISICEFGYNKPWEWAKGIGHLWRTTRDIADCWDCDDGKGNHLGWTKILDKQPGLEIYAGPGHWNDPDMLEIGNGGLSYEESKAHFSMWCMLAAPLIAGNDLRNMSAETKSILMNKELIALNQDPMGKQGVKIRDDGDFEVWTKQLYDGSKAIAFLNRSESNSEMSVQWSEIGYPNHLEILVRDLWLKKDFGKYKGGFSTNVPSHGVVVVKVTP